jgi:hypothetical protein
MIKPLYLALMIIDGKASFHPALIIKQDSVDVFENYQALCEANGHEPASSELGDYDKKE